MGITVFFDERDFFGGWQYCVEQHRSFFGTDEANDAIKKCFGAFGKMRNFAFRVDDGNRYGELYLIERLPGDAEAGVYTVTHIYGNNNKDCPVKMGSAAAKKLVREFFKKTIAA